MSKAKKPRTKHRRHPVKLAHGKTYADVLAQQFDDAAAKLNELRNIEGAKQQAEPGR